MPVPTLMPPRSSSVWSSSARSASSGAVTEEDRPPWPRARCVRMGIALR